MNENKDDIIRINKDELTSVDQYTTAVKMQNFQIAELRKQQLYNQLKVVSESRIKASESLDKWIDMLESRIFDDATLDSMTLKQRVSLIKYLINTRNKLIADTNHLDDVLSKHVDLEGTNAINLNKAENEITKSNKKLEQNQLKAQILAKVKKLFMGNDVTDANIVCGENDGDMSALVNNITKQASRITDKELEEENEEIISNVKPLFDEKKIQLNPDALNELDNLTALEDNIMNEEQDDDEEQNKSNLNLNDDDDDFDLEF